MGKAYRFCMVITLIIIIACAWLGIKIIFVGDRSAQVPAVVGMRLVEAVDKLQQQGLLAKIDEINSAEKAGTVISQNFPGGEKISKGKVVLLKVSRGASAVPVPDVRGMKYDVAVERLSDAGFKIEKVIRVTDKLKPAGTVIAHNPAAPQTVPSGEMITLLVSEGNGSERTFVTVPDITGQTVNMATEILKQTGLRIGRRNSIESEAETGTIVSTIPSKGRKVATGTMINITIAKPLTQQEEDVPPEIDTNKERAAAVEKAVRRDSMDSEIPNRNKEQNTEEKVTINKTESKQPTKKQKPVSQKKIHQKQATKNAKVRYQVPPLVKPLPLRIEMTDGNGAQVLKEMNVNGGEYLKIDVKYVDNAIITIYLGGDFVWQDRFN